MYLKDYILANEIVEKGNFNIANISMMIKDNKLEEGEDFLKFNGVVLINKKSNKLYKYIYNIINDNIFIDLSEYIPYVYFRELLDNNTNYIKNMYEEVSISGKKFIKITDKTLKKVLYNERKIKVIVPEKEKNELYRDKLIEGDLNVGKGKFLVWYSV